MPRKPSDKPKAQFERISVYCSKKEKAELDEACQRAGLKLSTWSKLSLLHMARTTE